MKRTIHLLAASSALGMLTTPILAQSAATRPAATDISQQQPSESFRKSIKASDLIGTAVYSYEDEKLGKVEELAVNVECGRIAQVIVSSGGFIGIGDKLFAVSPGALRYDATKKVIKLDANMAKLKAAPQFEMSKWDSSFDAKHLSEASDYYGTNKVPLNVQVDWSVSSDELATGTSNPMNSARTGQYHRVSKLLGMQVKNLQATKIGDVNNLLINLSTSRIVAVVISSGGFLGIADELSAVHPSAVRFTQDRDSLQLDATRESLTKAPHFASSQWPDFDQASYATQLSKSFAGGSKDPHSMDQQNSFAAADNTERNKRDRDDNSLTPLNQGNGTVDVDISARIRQEIMSSDRLSTNGKNVKVITRDSHVTLRGPTNTAEEKALIGEIADRIAGSSNVENQLEVKNTSPTNQ